MTPPGLGWALIDFPPLSYQFINGFQDNAFSPAPKREGEEWARGGDKPRSAVTSLVLQVLSITQISYRGEHMDTRDSRQNGAGILGP